MTAEKQTVTPDSEAPKLAPPKRKTPTAKPAAKTSKQGLITGWANATIPPDFDHDQGAVHEWSETEPKERLETLITEMTIADAEELIATCGKVAQEHRRRADRAVQLAEEVSRRLGKSYMDEYASDTAESVEREDTRTVADVGVVKSSDPTEVLTPRPIPAFLKQDDVAKAN